MPIWFFLLHDGPSSNPCCCTRLITVLDPVERPTGIAHLQVSGRPARYHPSTRTRCNDQLVPLRPYPHELELILGVSMKRIPDRPDRESDVQRHPPR